MGGACGTSCDPDGEAATIANHYCISSSYSYSYSYDPACDVCTSDCCSSSMFIEYGGFCPDGVFKPDSCAVWMCGDTECYGDESGGTCVSTCEEASSGHENSVDCYSCEDIAGHYAQYCCE